MKKTHACKAAILVAAAGLLLPTDASAIWRWLGATYNDGTYDFENPDYWRDKTTEPGTDAQVIFDQAGFANVLIPADSTFTVKLNENTAALRYLYFQAGTGRYEATLDLNGKTIAAANAQPFRIYGGTGTLGVVVNIESSQAGGIANFGSGTDYAYVGYTAGVSQLNILGSNTTVNVGRWSAGLVSESHGTLYIADGAKSTAAGLSQFGFVNDSYGKLHLSGANTSLTIGITELGRNGSADLVVEKGAQFIGSSTIFGNATSANANEGEVVTALITGSNSSVSTTGSTSIFLGNDHNAAEIEVTVASQGLMQSNRSLFVTNIQSGVEAVSTLAVDNGTVKVLGTAEDMGLYLRGRAHLDLTLYTADRDALVQVANEVELQPTAELILRLGTDAEFTPFEDFVALIEYGGLLHNGDGGAGRFSNYAQDDVFTLGMHTFQFDYAYQPDAEGPSYIGLHVIPEPHTMGMILLGLGAVALRRRLHKT